jgi:hypothetical protein
VVLRKLAALIALILTVLILDGCLDEAPSNDAIASLLEASANQELVVLKTRHPPGAGGDLIPDAVRIINLKNLGGVTDSKGIYVASIQFDLMIEHMGAQMLSQRGAKARLKLSRAGSGWRIVEKQ